MIVTHRNSRRVYCTRSRASGLHQDSAALAVLCNADTSAGGSTELSSHMHSQQPQPGVIAPSSDWSCCALHEDREKNKDPREERSPASVPSAGDVRGDVRPAASDPRGRLAGIIQVTLGRVSAEGSRCPAGMTPRGRDRHAGGGFLVSITRERFEPRTGGPPHRPPDACTSLASASADASSSGETRGRDETGSKLARPGRGARTAL